jgi:peptide deformylase
MKRSPAAVEAAGLMTVRQIVEIGDPVLCRRAREVSLDELRSPEVQMLIDDLIETRRAADGAGLAAPQIGESVRVAVAEIDGVNPRYPYKPPIPLTVLVNPVIEDAGDEAELINEGCLSLPDARAEVPRRMSITVRYLDREGTEWIERRQGLTAGTFQHEIDHLDGTLITDRAEPASVTSWEVYERSRREEFERRAREIVARFGQ